jgi:hypothetical protein
MSWCTSEGVWWEDTEDRRGVEKWVVVIVVNRMTQRR